MKKITLSLAFVAAFLMISNAQTAVGNYKDWKGTIDELEVLKSYDFSGRKTVYILPVETSEVELPEKKNENYNLVKNTLNNLTKMVADEMQKELQKAGYTVKVASKSDFRAEDAIVIQLNWTEFDLGSRALRYWVGFGAGHASFGTKGTIYDGKDSVITFNHRKLSAMDSRKYEKIAAKGVNAIADDLAKMVKNL